MRLLARNSFRIVSDLTDSTDSASCLWSEDYLRHISDWTVGPGHDCRTSAVWPSRVERFGWPKSATGYLTSV